MQKHKRSFRYLIFVVSFILLSLVSFSQKTISGKVTDSSGTAIIGAFISIVQMPSETGLFFSTTDSLGHYRFLIPKTGNNDLAIRVNAPGYIKVIKQILPTMDMVEFILAPDAKQLPDVLVKTNAPLLKISDDTITYRASGFMDKSDRTIQDIIKKIPGIEIQPDGIIKYQGLAINYFYIDGDNLLDNRYTIATKTLPPDIVEKIQIIENNQDI